MLIQNRFDPRPPVAASGTGRTAQTQGGEAPSAPGTRPLVEVREPRPAIAPEPAPSAEAVKAAVQRGNQALAALSVSLMFEIDADTQITVVKVVDKADNRVLRQFPSTEMLDIARALDRVQGALVRDEA